MPIAFSWWLTMAATVTTVATAAAAAAAARAGPPDKSLGGAGLYSSVYRPTYAKQDTQSILALIEERLRTLDAVSAANQHHARRLDAIEGKLERLENVLSLRLERAAEAVGARAELAAERLAHRLDMAQIKAQTTMETNMARLERGQKALSSRLEDAGRINITEHVLQPLKQHVAAVEARLQADQTPPSSCNASASEALASKMSSLYDAAWRRGLALEAAVNATRRDLADGLRALGRRPLRAALPHYMHPGSSAADVTVALEQASVALKRVAAQALDSKLDRVALMQQLILESCQRIQLNEPQLEAEIARVLEQLVTFVNKTYTEQQLTLQLVKSHDLRAAHGMARAVAAYVQRAPSPSTARDLRALTNRVEVLTSATQHLLQRHKDHHARTNETQFLAKEVRQEVEKAIANIPLVMKNSSDTCLFSLKNEELNLLVEKLIDLTGRIDVSFVQLERRIHNYDSYHEFDKSSSGIEDGGRHKNEITDTADELINKLNKINNDNSTEEDYFYLDLNEVNNTLASKFKLEDDPLSEDSFYDDDDFDSLLKPYQERKVTSEKPTTTTIRLHRNHKRHLHRQPYDRGPRLRQESTSTKRTNGPHSKSGKGYDNRNQK